MTTNKLIKISDPLTLPCGATLPNRLAKAAMTEGLATPDGIPTEALCRLYSLWADGGAGLLITGNIQIDRDHLERPGNVILQGGQVDSDDDTMIKALQKWAQVATRHGKIHCWAQISHGGRQVNIDVNPNPKAPSAVQLGLPGGRFGKPVALTVDEIHDLIQAFAMAAKTLQHAGFTGVQIHAAHGYLVSSFLNPRVNQRTDEYGGQNLENRARMLLEIVEKTREAVGPKFPISVKINSADFQRGGFLFQDSLQVVQWLEKAGVDLIEISGGNYEQAAMMNMPGMEDKFEQNVNVAPSTQVREAYFLDFAKAMQQVVRVPLMVTGGFRTRVAMDYALESRGADVIGLGRPMCIMTDAPNQLLQNKIQALPRYEDQIPLIPNWLGFLKRFQMLKVVDAFGAVFWFYEQLESLGQTGKANEALTPFRAFITVHARNNRILSERTMGVTAVVHTKQNRSIGFVSTRQVVLFGMTGLVAFGAGFLMNNLRRK